MAKAIPALEAVVREDPTYRDSLTLLGRAYYRTGRYQDANAILQRAVVVNQNDEIAWFVLGLTQLRLGQNQVGLETVKGGLTLLSKASVRGYRDYPDWDSKNLVRSSIQRTAFLAAKGQEEKDNLLRSADALLIRIDDEENFQRVDSMQEYRRGYSSQ
jgi:tetratricopeptide (TPR) repeat protein